MSQAVADILTGPHAPAREAAESYAPAATKRWLGLDLFRFGAVVLMVQGHVFSTLLDQATKSQSWYPHHAFLHGYTAPMFLFGAGLAFGYTTFRNWDAQANGGRAANKRYRRYLWLLAIGYGLHFPSATIEGLISVEDPTEVARMFQVDVLQHIGVTLAFAQLLVFLLKRQRVFVGVLTLIALASVLFAPWVWGLDVSGLPVWMQGYVNASSFSYFPIVPWVGFTYGGIVIAYAVGLDRGGESVSERVAWPFLVLSLFFMITPVVIDRLGPFAWPVHNFWKTNPLFFLWRLGNVMFVLALLCFAERRARRAGWLEQGGSKLLGALRPWVQLAAAETLIIYVVHLVVLHGSALNPGLKHSGIISEHSHGVVTAALISAALFVAIVLVAKGWSELRRHKGVLAAVQIGMIGVIGLLILTR